MMNMHQDDAKREPSVAATGVSIDPVCGMTVKPDVAAGSHEYNGQTYYFCSAHCLKKFHEDPERFLNKSPEGMPVQPVGIQRAPKAPAAGQSYTCPMHPEVKQDKPGSCPKCGMALEPVTVTAPQHKIEYTCPMHPEIVRDAPGNCPICGMALEPRTITLADEENHELKDMRRRFWVSVVLTIPVFAIGMSDLIPGAPLQGLVPPTALTWIQLMLASPVVLWGGWPFFVRAWHSVANRSPNMFTLIGLGVGVAYG
jgi:Cu+-exporting ATPase